MNVEEAFKNKVSEIPLTIKGKVSKILDDDTGTTPHQRFIVEIHSGHTVFVAHNTQRAYRAPIKIGDGVEVHGTYVWNKHGGILHNTHHYDKESCLIVSGGKKVCGPVHEDGWIIFVGKKDPQRKVQSKT
jgi:hypothetical protein